MLDNFQKSILTMGLKSHDCHPQLKRDNEYKGLGLGGGAICLEEAYLFMGLIAAVKPDYVIELGTSQGGSTIAIAAILKDFGKGTIISVDMAPKPPEKAIELRRLLYVDNIKFVSQHSLEFLSSFEPMNDKTYLVFSDTDIAVRPEEVKLVLKKFPKGTVIVVHDTSDQHPFGPMKLKEKISHPVVELPTPRGISLLTV